MSWIKVIMAGLKKTGLGIVAAYVSYKAYLMLNTKMEISRRAAEEQEQLLAKSGLPFPHRKFGSLSIGGRFENPFPEYRPQTLFEFFYCRIHELFETRPRGGIPFDSETLRKLLPVFQPDFSLLASQLRPPTADPESRDLPPPRDRLTLTWIGQSCAYVQMDNLSILTDPIFENFLMHHTFGPKRIQPAPCQIEQLPRVDYVFVSHDHPDHLEEESIAKIGNSALWVVPLGVRHFLNKRGVYNVAELDWWEKMDLSTSQSGDKYEVVCTPAMHWSGRYIFDTNKSLWCSFLVLRNGEPMFFHAGDTGYAGEVFRGIRQLYGSGCRVAMIPCGSYEPSWHQKPRHVNPSEAIQIMEDLGAKKMIGVHWGTFVLSSENFLAPKMDLERLAKLKNRQSAILAPEFGRTMIFDVREKGGEERKSLVRDGKAWLIE